ncbi:MAG TPA: GGDEF domain-containing protein [Lachnospiraceae bacterium]|nr:GGDEF domain-containing protein [Lachnospiraceae bacterium]
MEINDEVKEQFFDILNNKKISPRYQPIVSLKSGEIYGYEALSRITLENCCFNTEQMFQIARNLKKIWELEKICRTLSLKNAAGKPKDKKLFLNVDANIIHDEEFQNGITLKRLQEYSLSPEDIIFEITERSAIEDLKTFQESVSHYKSQHFKIAIDDVGSGYSGLNRICALSPSLLKIDMAIIRDIDKDSIKQALVMGILRFCQDTNINLVAEGIETKEELKTIIELGVCYGQGYHIAKPQIELIDIAVDIKNTIKNLNSNSKNNVYQSSFLGTVETICKEKIGIHYSTKADSIYEEMKKDTSSTEVCIVDDMNYVIGVLTRANLLQLFGGRYGYNLNSKKTVEELMCKNYLAVDSKTAIETVSNMALARTDDKLYDSVVITQKGKYLGIVTIKDLLQTAITIQVSRAVDCNPLTGLPGNRVIEKKIFECIQSDEPFSIIYLDIDNFKAYNDAYGFNNGDLMLQALSDCIKKACFYGEFMGHIGGDDFVIISNSWDVECICKKIIELFTMTIKDLYSLKDWENGYILSKNRFGIEENFPIASLSISALTNKQKRFSNVYEFSKTIAGLKKKCKQHEGNYIMII